MVPNFNFRVGNRPSLSVGSVQMLSPSSNAESQLSAVPVQVDADRLGHGDGDRIGEHSFVSLLIAKPNDHGL